MQTRALRAAGYNTELVCQRGGWRFWARAGLRAQRVSEAASQQLVGSPDVLLIDHGMELPGAQIVFAHNLMTQAQNFVDRPDYRSGAERERSYFSALNKQALVVANSRLVGDAIKQHFDWPAEQVRVCYPGFRAVTFSSERRAALRAEARGALGISDDTPLVGFVTSGDFQKRGLDMFVDTAQAMLAKRPELRFLVAGSRMLPSWMQQHELLQSDRLIHRPRGARPERWMSALDVFLYPAHFEEFGMVVLEACALGVPIITTRRVGAVECLPDEYTPWVSDAPQADVLSELSLRLLDDEPTRETLRSAGIAAAATHNDERYAKECVSIVASRLEATA